MHLVGDLSRSESTLYSKKQVQVRKKVQVRKYGQKKFRSAKSRTESTVKTN